MIENSSSNYSFRIRVNRSPTDTIETTDYKLVLAEDAGGRQIFLTGGNSDQPLNEAPHFVLHGSGYSTEAEAMSEGQFYEAIFMIALARVRIGADFGDRSYKGAFTVAGLQWLEQQVGQRMLNSVHGLMVYSTEPKPRFAYNEVNAIRGVKQSSLLQAFSAAAIKRPTIDERERLALTLFNASFFQITVEGKFLLLVMAIEALIELLLRSDESQAHVRSLIDATKKAKIPEKERASMLGAIRWLQKESIGQAGKRLVENRLGTRKYDEKSAADFFSYVYQMRSNLVHGNMPYPTLEMVGAAAATLEVFVSELLTAKVIDLPEQVL